MGKEFQIIDGNLIASFDLENEDGDIDFCKLLKVSHGVANEIGMFVDYIATNKIIKDQSNKITDLEAKLAESEKERELDNSFWKQECDGLQKALAEKTLTIEQINKAFIGNRSLWKGKYERANQDKISFAVEVLKIAQDYVQQYVNDFDDMNDCICAIDKLIKQLTHQHEDKGE